jgi:hypothetical protein
LVLVVLAITVVGRITELLVLTLFLQLSLLMVGVVAVISLVLVLMVVVVVALVMRQPIILLELARQVRATTVVERTTRHPLNLLVAVVVLGLLEAAFLLVTLAGTVALQQVHL